MKIYQVTEVHFDRENGYLNVESPFTKNMAYKKERTARMVFDNLVKEYTEDAHTIKVEKPNKDIASILTSNKRIVISLDIVELVS